MKLSQNIYISICYTRQNIQNIKFNTIYYSKMHLQSTVKQSDTRLPTFFSLKSSHSLLNYTFNIPGKRRRDDAIVSEKNNDASNV